LQSLLLTSCFFAPNDQANIPAIYPSSNIQPVLFPTFNTTRLVFFCLQIILLLIFVFEN
jgi:hypothetical protein